MKRPATQRASSPPSAPLDALFRSSEDDWAEEASRQAATLAGAPLEPHGLLAKFRRKLATGEALSRALARLAEALRFSGRITVTLHQGKVTKTVLEESYFGGKSRS